MKECTKETKHITAYLDVLGVKKKITNCENDFLMQLNDIYAQAKDNCIKLNSSDGHKNLPPIKQKIFSDNIIFAEELKNGFEIFQVFNFVLFISAYLHKAFAKGFLIRGGLTIGNLYMDETFVSGLALLNAYKLESQIAIYPRVVLDFEVFGCLSQIENELWEYFNIPVGDDLIYHLDGFRVVFLPNGKKINFAMIKERILNACKYEENMKIVQKHLWVITQYNDFCKANNKEEFMIDVISEYANIYQLAIL